MGKTYRKTFFKKTDAIKYRKQLEEKYFKPIVEKYNKKMKGGDEMADKTQKSPKDLLIEQETAELENMTEGQLAEYLANEAENEPF